MGLPKTLLFGPDEFKDLKNLISKKSTSSWGGRRKPPRAFTESGLYMLMKVLRRELATKQSGALIRNLVLMNKLPNTER